MNIPQYWTQEDIKDAEDSVAYKDLLKIVWRILKRMPQPVTMISGPISTGGKGSIESNIKELQQHIQKLSGEGLNVFNQLAFQDYINRIKDSPTYKPYLTKKNNSNKLLLDLFFYPIFMSRYIKKLYFLPDWQSSEGCRREHDFALELGIPVIYLN